MELKSTRSASTDSSFSMEDFEKALEQFDYEFQRGQVVQGKVISYETDGAFVDIGAKSPAFLPLQEASLRRITDISLILPLNEEREFLIIKEQDADGQVTVSLRQFEIKQVWDNLADMQSSNQSLQVRVTGTNKGGVTVDVQGLQGFIPRSHLAGRDDLESLKGSTLTAVILELNRDRNKLVLSNRLATRSVAFSQLEVGQLVEGKVSGIRPFGVFVDLDGTSALLHINQISKNYIESLPALFQVGQPIKAIIADLDEGRGRISLSTKVLENFPGEMLENAATVMAEAGSRQERARKMFQ
ncbi:S1 RNA-binding domain-containing protein [Leptothermofonsia sichuanensis E412]|nr:S1 RNA-binding domain-containing protein [Leptothermofonsia sichuanensis]QZZ19095.1 S1 RNA-binding domain-containing protein [Leptothermofonsia sichuanensis E412]